MEKININSLPIFKLLVFLFPSLLLGIFLPNYLKTILLLTLGFFGILLFAFGKLRISFVLIALALGLVISFNFRQFYQTKKTNKFSITIAKIFGRITDLFPTDENALRIRLVGEIQSEHIKGYHTTILLDVWNFDQISYKLDVGNQIFCHAIIWYPRKSNLPTDPAEFHSALAYDVEFRGLIYPQDIIKVWENPNAYKKFLMETRKSLQENLKNIFNSENYTIFSALLLGNRTLLEEEQKQKFAITGMSHILALSGFHFGILSAIVFFLFSFLKSKWFRFTLVAISLLGYLAIVDFPPSGIRATIMILSFLYSYTLERKPSVFNVLSLILLIILIFSPKSLFNVGFQLSFFAVLGIVLFYQRFYFFFTNMVKTKNKVLFFFLSILSVTISAQIFTAPLVAIYFGYYTFVSFFSNLILLPLFSMAITFGFASLLISLISTSFGKIFGLSADFFIFIATQINDWLAKSFENFIVNENGVVLLSIIISIIFIWLSATLHFKQLLFKTAFSVVILILLLTNLGNYKHVDTLQIFPRMKYVAIVIPSKEKSICLLLDRKPRQFPSGDKAMEKYITSLSGKLVIGVSGNAGIAVSDNIKKQRDVTILEIPSELQRKISYAIYGDLRLFKL